MGDLRGYTSSHETQEMAEDPHDTSTLKLEGVTRMENSLRKGEHHQRRVAKGDCPGWNR